MVTGGLVSTLLVGLCSNAILQITESNSPFNCSLRLGGHAKKNSLVGKKLKILTYDDPPLSYTEIDDDGILRGKGVSFELLETLQEIYGFEYEVIKSDSKFIGDDTSGILGEIASGEVDMAAGFLPVLPGTNKYIKWGTDLTQYKYYVMMKRPAASATGNGLLASFSMEVWFLILANLISVGPIFYMVMWARNRLCEDPSIKIYPISSCVWFVYGALMKQGSTLNPETDSSRIIFATWWLFILILTAFYTANLTAFLTLSIFTLPINSLEDVAKPANKWFAASGGAIEFSIKNELGDLDALKQSVENNHAKFIEVDDQKVLSFVSEDWFYLDDWSTLTRIIFKDYLRKTSIGDDESKRCTYVLAKESFLLRSVAFAYPNGSDLPSYFNPVLQYFVESGIIKHLTSMNLPVSPICPLNLGSKERTLMNSDLLATYTVVIVGFVFALVIFACEMALRRIDKSIKRSRKIQVKPEIVDAKFNTNKMVSFSESITKNINGRDYIMVTLKNGQSQLIPVRNNSAVLFHYR